MVSPIERPLGSIDRAWFLKGGAKGLFLRERRQDQSVVTPITHPFGMTQAFHNPMSRLVTPITSELPTASHDLVIPVQQRRPKLVLDVRLKPTPG